MAKGRGFAFQRSEPQHCARRVAEVVLIVSADVSLHEVNLNWTKRKERQKFVIETAAAYIPGKPGIRSR